MGVPATKPALIFTYGNLKQGFSNHPLLQGMISAGDATFVGACCTFHRLPLVCEPYRVPFLLNLPGRGHRVSGEIYAVSLAAQAEMDVLEGIGRGHCERLPIEIEITESDGVLRTAELCGSTGSISNFTLRGFISSFFSKCTNLQALDISSN